MDIDFDDSPESLHAYMDYLRESDRQEFQDAADEIEEHLESIGYFFDPF